MSQPALLTPNRLPPSPYEAGLLAWEDAEAFRSLRDDYVFTYQPVGPAETHILEQLVWCDWRRRRLVMAERALHMASLDRATSIERNDRLTQRALALTDGTRPELSSGNAVRSSDDEDDRSEAEWADMLAAAEMARALLEAGKKDAYARALASLPEETAEWFLEDCQSNERRQADAEGLRDFLVREVLPFFRAHLAGARGGPAVRLQAFGESLDPFRMDKLLALDERLTRQFEKAMGMLIRLQEMRRVTLTPK